MVTPPKTQNLVTISKMHLIIFGGSFLSTMKTNNNSSKKYFSPYFRQKQSMEKIPIFDQNSWTTPLRKFEFFPLFEKKYVCPRKRSFLFRVSAKIFVGLFCPKTKHGKNFNF